MVLTIVVGITCLCLGFLISLLIKTTKVRKINQEIERKEQEIQLAIKEAELEYNELSNNFEKEQMRQTQILKDDYQKWTDKKTAQNLSLMQAEMKLKENIAGLESQIEEKKKTIETLDQQNSETVKSLEEKIYDLMVEDFTQRANLEIDQCKYLSEQAQEQYEEMMKELMQNYQQKSEETTQIINTLIAQLNEAAAKAQAITESNKKAELSREEKDYYRLQLSDLDIEEIKKIRSIEPYLRKKEPLNKVIWKVYYEKPYTDLIGRVVGAGTHIGIYKITNLINGMTYVGQSNNIAERWKQHIKRGVGADPPTQNKLYPAMLEFGAENFTFEIIEECLPSQLNEREKYYQQIFGSQEFGYSIR